MLLISACRMTRCRRSNVLLLLLLQRMLRSGRMLSGNGDDSRIVRQTAAQLRNRLWRFAHHQILDIARLENDILVDVIATSNRCFSRTIFGSE